MKRSVFGALMTLIVAFSIAVPVVNAQQTIMTANVPFAFSIGDTPLPAGAYAVREEGRATLVQSKDAVYSVLRIYNYAGPSEARSSFSMTRIVDVPSRAGNGPAASTPSPPSCDRFSVWDRFERPCWWL